MSQKEYFQSFSKDPPRVFPCTHVAAATHLAMFPLPLEKLQTTSRVEHFAVSKPKFVEVQRCGNMTGLLGLSRPDSAHCQARKKVIGQTWLTKDYFIVALYLDNLSSVQYVFTQGLQKSDKCCISSFMFLSVRFKFCKARNATELLSDRL